MKKMKIQIVGGGTAGWMVAAAFSKLLDSKRFEISLIESDKIGTVGVGEATIPSIRHFNRLLEIDEIDFMKNTSATFKLGIQFENWGKVGDSYIHPFGDFRYSLSGLPVGIHHYWSYAKQKGFKSELGAISLPVQMCQQFKFELPSTDKRQLHSTYNYAYHFNATAYAAYLRKFAEARGVLRKEGVIHHVNTDGDKIIFLQSDSEIIEADFFIDASGFQSLLLGKALNVDFEDWSKYLICDSAVAAPSTNNSFPPYTRAIANESGWQWSIPLQNRAGNGLVYSSEFMKKSTAEDNLVKSLGDRILRDPIHIKFKAGKRVKAWKGNCVAIGLSGGFLEPLESTSIYLIQESVLKLIDFLKFNNTCDTSIKTYNALIDKEYERIKDFIILHYHLTKRDDSDFWRYCKNMDVPESLKYKIELFKEAGIIESYKYGLFQVPSWLSVLVGQGLIPEGIDRRVHMFPPEFIMHQLDTLISEISKSVSTMHTQEQFLKWYLN